MAVYQGAEIIVDYLVKEGVPYVFGLCGHGDIGFLDAAYRRRNEIKVISTRHEQAAIHMADAYFRVAHRPAATITSCGPGSANLTVGLACAMMDSSAVFCITGNVPTSQFNRGAFQETYRHQQAEFPEVLRPYVKRAYQTTRVEQVPIAVRDAFRVMLGGRPGPVLLDVPLNVFLEEADVELPDPASWRWGLSVRPAGEPEAVSRAVDLLLAAERPLILAGHGVVLAEAAAELSELAYYLNVPVQNTPQGKGAFDMRDSLSLGDTGRNGTYAANQAGRTCDVLLALGARFDDRAASAWVPGGSYSIPPTRLVQVDIDPEELGRNYPATVGVLGDVKMVLRQMIELVKARSPRREGLTPWLADIQGWQRQWEEDLWPGKVSEATPVHPARLVSELRAILPEDGILLVDVGVHHNWFVQQWPASRPGTMLQSWGFGAMGFAVCGVVGAKLAAPDRPCVAVCGDGGFMMTPHAVATAVEYDIPAVWVVWNNYGYCSIRDMQLANFGREYATSFVRERTGELTNPDFAALARAMGAGGVRVEHPADLKAALVEALGAGRPYVVEVVVDREVRPLATGTWELPPLPRPKPTYPLA